MRGPLPPPATMVDLNMSASDLQRLVRRSHVANTTVTPNYREGAVSLYPNRLCVQILEAFTVQKIPTKPLAAMPTRSVGSPPPPRAYDQWFSDARLVCPRLLHGCANTQPLGRVHTKLECGARMRNRSTWLLPGISTSRNEGVQQSANHTVRHSTLCNAFSKCVPYTAKLDSRKCSLRTTEGTYSYASSFVARHMHQHTVSQPCAAPTTC